MDKKEILKLSREENQNGDERAKNVGVSASRLAGIVTIIVAFVFAAVDSLLGKENILAYACLSIVSLHLSISHWYMYAKLKRKNDCGFAIAETFWAIALIVITIVRMVKVY